MTIDQEGDGNAENSSVQLANFRVSHYNGIIHLELFREFSGRLGIIVHRYADDLEAAVSVFVLQLNEMRRLLAAREAPAGPKVDEHDFPAEIRQPQRLAVELRKGEFGRQDSLIFADDGGAREPAAPNRVEDCSERE